MSRPLTDLRALERAREAYDEHSAIRKREWVDHLADARFQRASAVLRFHDVLCFLRAYPETPELLKSVESALRAFGKRADVRDHCEELVNSGVAGTAIDYAFFWPTAHWLTTRWPGALHIRWDAFEHARQLHRLLKVLLPYAERVFLDEAEFDARKWVEALKGDEETDAEFLVRRFARLKTDPLMREMAYDDLVIPMRLEPRRTTPSRTRARYAGSPVIFQTEPRSRARPRLRAEVRRPPQQVTRLSRDQGREIIRLAREAMLTRQRDLDAIADANPDDVLLVDCENGLQFAWFGARPERRHILETVYAFLTLKNGVPIGYVQAASVFGSAEVNFNIFDPFRGGDAAWVYGRALATIHHLMGTDAFVIDPYQLGGEGNTEAQRTGAWWFYYKLGFRPRDGYNAELAREEGRRVKANPKYRTPVTRLRVLGEHPMYLYLGRRRSDVISVLPLEAIGQHVSRALAHRFGADRERGLRILRAEAAQALGIRRGGQMSRAERIAWERWSPIVAVLPDLDRWTDAERAALREVIRAKGAPHELDYLRAFEQHTRLREALTALAVAPG